MYDSHEVQRRGTTHIHNYNERHIQDRRSAQIYPDNIIRYATYSPRSSSLMYSAETSPVPSLTHKNSASDTSPPSLELSQPSPTWETSWFHDDETLPPSVYDRSRDSAVTFDDSCQYDADDWFAQFRGELDISDDVPTPAKVASAGDIPVYDSAGNSRLFKSLFSVGDVVGDRQLIIFIRHFYCGVSLALHISHHDHVLT